MSTCLHVYLSTCLLLLPSQLFVWVEVAEGFEDAFADLAASAARESLDALQRGDGLDHLEQHAHHLHVELFVPRDPLGEAPDAGAQQFLLVLERCRVLEAGLLVVRVERSVETVVQGILVAGLPAGVALHRAGCGFKRVCHGFSPSRMLTMLTAPPPKASHASVSKRVRLISTDRRRSSWSASCCCSSLSLFSMSSSLTRSSSSSLASSWCLRESSSVMASPW